jgi:hypothetical protein
MLTTRGSSEFRQSFVANSKIAPNATISMIVIEAATRMIPLQTFAPKFCISEPIEVPATRVEHHIGFVDFPVHVHALQPRYPHVCQKGTC